MKNFFWIAPIMLLAGFVLWRWKKRNANFGYNDLHNLDLDHLETIDLQIIIEWFTENSPPNINTENTLSIVLDIGKTYQEDKNSPYVNLVKSKLPKSFDKIDKLIMVGFYDKNISEILLENKIKFYSYEKMSSDLITSFNKKSLLILK